eukprot:scaffold32061_cov171-Skeletonema_menzelii.AAC.1
MARRRHTTTATSRPTILQVQPQATLQQQQKNDGSELLVMSSKLLDKSITSSCYTHHDDSSSSKSTTWKNDGNELLTMSSSAVLDQSCCNSDYYDLLLLSSRPRRYTTRSTIGTTKERQQQQQQQLNTMSRPPPPPQRHQRKASNARRSLSMNDAHCYQVEELEYESVGSDDEGYWGLVGEGRRMGGNGSSKRCVGGRNVEHNLGHDTVNATAGDHANATGRTSCSSEREARHDDAVVVNGKRYDDDSSTHNLQGSIKNELSRKAEEEEGCNETTKKGEKKNQQRFPRQQCLDNNIVATTEYSLTLQPMKKQPLTTSSIESSDSRSRCSEINRIYNTTPRQMNDDTLHRRHRCEQQQRGSQHSSSPTLPPPQQQQPPASSNFSTNSNNSIMNDYIQLKLKVAELQSDLQHFQAETSKYKVELIHLYKENEELQRENEALLCRWQGNNVGGVVVAADGSCESELKKENEFMKRVLYNLERLGKIDKVDDLLKSRLDDDEAEEILVGFRNINKGRDNNAVGTNAGNQRPLLWPLHSSLHSSMTMRCRGGEELYWSNSASSKQRPPPKWNDNGPRRRRRRRRGPNLFRRFSAPPVSDDNIVEVEELPMMDTTAKDTRVRQRSFSHGSLSSLFRWPTDSDNQDTSTNEASVRLDQSGTRSQFQQSRPRSLGNAIKSIQRSLSSSPNLSLRDSNDPVVGNDPNEKNDDADKKDVPEFVHTDEDPSLLQMSEISLDVVPSSRIPTMGGTSSHCNVDIRQTAKEASTRPMHSDSRNRGLFGNFMREIIREES